MAWTLDYIQKLQSEGKIEGFKVIGGKNAAKVSKAKKTPDGVQFIISVLEANKVPYIQEYQFAPPRKFRFDFAIPDLKIAAEYEGIFSKKSRHTTQSGYSKDCEKYNLAATNGWRVLRYTAKTVKSFEQDLITIINPPNSAKKSP